MSDFSLLLDGRRNGRWSRVGDPGSFHGVAMEVEEESVAGVFVLLFIQEAY